MTRHPLSLCVFGLLAAGTLFRVLPVFGGAPMLAEFFVTEDGYLMLTVARNMALGLGMTVSDGTIPTNGVQPLATFLFAGAHVVAAGDKMESLIGVHLISAAAALGGAFAVRSFAARVLAPHDPDPLWPWLAAGLWYVGPLLVLHSMNGLETGIYTLALLITLLQFCHVLERGADASMGAGLMLGALTGVTFLARNDGVFLAIAIFAIWSLNLLIRERLGLVEMLRRVVPAGLLSVAIVMPWLVNNYVYFGSIVPISGTAQSMGADFGSNALLLPSQIFEHMFPMLPVPGALQLMPAVVAITAAASAVVLGWFLFRVWQRGGIVGLAVLAYLLHGAVLAFYYGFFFGASYFLTRYLAPLAPLLILASLVVLIDLARLVNAERARALIAGVGIAGLALGAVLSARLMVPGVKEQGHFQVVDWVDDNLPDETWVAAVQTGTLGYWHDRTINLDGKVNPAALIARRERGNVLGYLVASEIDYIADWHGIAAWSELTDDGFSESFELLVDQPAQNLAVLRRRGVE
ncbi:MAG: hypothetical protein AAF577_10090 [Pseudomonadota bacterium]